MNDRENHMYNVPLDFLEEKALKCIHSVRLCDMPELSIAISLKRIADAMESHGQTNEQLKALFEHEKKWMNVTFDTLFMDTGTEQLYCKCGNMLTNKPMEDCRTPLLHKCE